MQPAYGESSKKQPPNWLSKTCFQHLQQPSPNHNPKILAPEIGNLLSWSFMEQETCPLWSQNFVGALYRLTQSIMPRASLRTTDIGCEDCEE